LAHRGLVPDDDRWARYGPEATGVGWDVALLGFALCLPTGEALDQATIEQDPAVREFIRGRECPGD
jgi:hypothetical protein